MVKTYSNHVAILLVDEFSDDAAWDCDFGSAIEIAVITSKSALLTEAIVLKIGILRAR